MLSSIQLSPGGLEAPAGPVRGKTTGSPSTSNSFDQVMDRALARNPEDPQTDSPSQQPRSKTLPQKSLPRPSANPSARPAQRPTPAVTQDPQPSTEAPSPTSSPGSSGATRSTSAKHHHDSGSVHDAVLIQGPPSPILPTVPEPAPRLNGSDFESNPVERASTSPAIGLSVDATSGHSLAARGKESSTVESTKPAPDASPANLPMQKSAETVPADLSPMASDRSQAAPPADNSHDANSANAVTVDSSDAQVTSPNGPAPPGAITSEGVPDKPKPGVADGVQIKAALQLTHGPPAASTGNEFPQSVGTSGAKQEMSMKKAEKVQKTADLSQQNLPSEGAVTAGQTDPKASQAPLTSPLADLDKVALATSGGHIEDKLAGSVETVSNPVNAATADARLTSLERTHDLVAMHALRLSQSGNDSLRVVLEPGGGTRLSIDLRFSNGGIQAEALLHRGDFNFLNTHWAELQQRLEPRGVHLGDLKCSDQSGGGQEQFKSPGRQSTEERPNRSAFAEFALDDEMSDSPAARRARTKTHVGWETWA